VRVALRLLVIDDSEDDLLLVVHALRAAGLAVEARRVDQPDDLAAALGEREWDLCLLDWVMPELTAPEVMRAMRESRQPQLPCIVWSGRNDPKVAFVAKEVLGAIGFVPKGAMAQELPELVRGAIGDRGGTP
jgi:DNA-binding NtrC family response regulator